MPQIRAQAVSLGGTTLRHHDQSEVSTPRTKRSDELFQSVKSLAGLSASMLYLAEAGNDRLTINQVAFFLIAAAADIRGRALSLTEIMDATEGVINRSVANTYKVLLEPVTRDYKNTGLGWLERQPDPDDERRNYLVLTKKGRAVVKAMLIALGQPVYVEPKDTEDEAT